MCILCPYFTHTIKTQTFIYIYTPRVYVLGGHTAHNARFVRGLHGRPHIIWSIRGRCVIEITQFCFFCLFVGNPLLHGRQVRATQQTTHAKLTNRDPNPKRVPKLINEQQSRSAYNVYIYAYIYHTHIYIYLSTCDPFSVGEFHHLLCVHIYKVKSDQKDIGGPVRVFALN